MASPTKPKSGTTLTLTAEGSLVDGSTKLPYNTHINNALGANMKVGTTIPSSTGGTITFTKTGLIHKAGNAYSGKIAAVEAKQKPAKKKG